MTNPSERSPIPRHIVEAVDNDSLHKRTMLTSPEVIEQALEEYFAASDEGRLCPKDAYDILFFNGLVETGAVE